MNECPRLPGMQAWGLAPRPAGPGQLTGAAMLVAMTIGLASLGAPATTAATCPESLIPLYPSSQSGDGQQGLSLVASTGRFFVATDDPLVDVQRFYSLRLPNEAWVSVPQLPGQYIDQFSRGGYTPQDNIPQGVLEFSRSDGRESVRIVGEGGGYSIYTDCRD